MSLLAVSLDQNVGHAAKNTLDIEEGEAVRFQVVWDDVACRCTAWNVRRGNNTRFTKIWPPCFCNGGAPSGNTYNGAAGNGTTTWNCNNTGNHGNGNGGKKGKNNNNDTTHGGSYTDNDIGSEVIVV